MKKFLLFWFTAAFLLASVNTFAQSGKPVKVTNDKQLQTAMANPAVTQMELAGGFYPSQSLEAGDGTLLTKGTGSNKGPGDCNYFITPTSYCFTGAPSAGTAVAGTTGPLCTVTMVGTWSYTTTDGGTLTWTDGVPTNYTENFTVNQAGTYTLTYTWTGGVGGSGAPAGTKVTSDWYFYPQPAAVITTPANVCGLTTTFDVDFDFGTVVMPSTPSITWTLDGVPFVGPTADATGVSLTVATCGTKVLKVAMQYGPCTVVEVQKTIKFYDQPSANAGDDKTACGLSATLAPGTPSASCLNGGSIGTAWSYVSGPGTATFSGNVATVTQCGTYVFRYTTTNGECTNTDDVTVKYYDTPTGGTAGTDFGVCGTSTTLVPTVYSVSCTNGGTLTHGWAIFGAAPGTATFSGNGVVVSACGTYTFRYTATNGDCSVSDDVTVKFYDMPDAQAGVDKSTCGLSVTLTPGTPSVSCLNDGTMTKVWSHTGGTGLGTATFTGNVATVTACGTYEFTYTVTNGECVDTDVVEVKYYDTPAGGNAGSDKEFCGLTGALTPTDYTVNCLNGGTLGHAWTKVAGPAGTVTFTANNVAVSVCGTYTFRYTATNGDCSIYDEVDVKFFDTPVADAGKDASVCGLTITLDPSFTANCQNAATATEGWTKTSGPGIVTFVGNVATVSECGLYVFEYRVDNGPCFDVDDVTVKFFSTPTGVTAGTDKNECGNTTTLTPDYTIACGTLGTPVIGWTQTAGIGTATFTGSDKTWSVTVSQCGEYTFEYSVDNGPCDPVTAAVTIKFFDTPTGTSAGTDADVCGVAATLAPTLGTVSCDHGTTPTGAWSVFSGGTATFTGNDVVVAGCGSYVFRYTTTNGPCSAYDDVTIRFFDTPVGTSAGTDAEVCGLSATLSPAQGTVGCDHGVTRVNTWTLFSGPGTATFSGNAVVVEACGTYKFVYTSVNGPCSASDTVSVAFHSSPTIAFDAEPANVCGYNTSFYYSFDADCFKASYGGNWTYNGPLGGVATLNTAVAGTLGITVNLCGSYDFIYTVTNGICTEDDTVTIRFYETPNPQITGELDVYTCSTVTYTVTDGRTCDFGGLKHLWTVSGGVISGSATGTTVTVDWNQFTGTGTITVTSELDDNPGCVASESGSVTKIAPTFAGQVKYWNAFETYMPTPFPTDFYGTFPEDYFYVTLCKMDGASVVEIETKLVEPRLMEDLVELMSSFEFTLPVASDGCDVDYLLKIWDGGLTYHSLYGGPTPPPVSGTYLGESYTYTNWGGGNATDALALQLMVGNATNINGAPYNYAWVGTNSALPTPYGYYSKSIGDVNLSGTITALDALTLNYRAVGLIGSFPNSIPGKQYSPNFKVTGRMVTALPQMTWPAPFYTPTNVNDVPFTHSGTSYLYFTNATDHKYTSSLIPWEGKKNYMNIYYTATGDINSSYVPTSAGFKAEPAMSLILEGEQAVNAGDVVTIPVRVDRNSELGAITLGLSYRNDLVEVIGTNYGADFAKIDTEKSLINIGWFSTDGINVSENEAIAYITVRVLANIEKGTSLFTLQANTEFADRSANVIEGVNLKSTAVYTGKTGSELNATNYPNPFSNTTTISYNLPEAGNVQIAIFNKLGQSVRTLVDGIQSAGAHTFELTNANLQPGVYQYRITLTGKNGSYSVVKSMIVVE